MPALAAELMRWFREGCRRDIDGVADLLNEWKPISSARPHLDDRYNRARVHDMAIVTERFVTPIFSHDTGGQTLHHNSLHSGVEFTISLQPYSHSPDGNFDEIIKFAAPGVRALLIDNRMFFSEVTRTLASHVLIVDVRESRTDEEPIFSRFDAAFNIQESALSAIRLTSSAGVWSERTFQFRDPSTLAGGMSYSKPYGSVFRHMGSPSILVPAEFTRCIIVVDALRARFASANGTVFHNIFLLAWNYHRLAITFENPSHGFLILMIAFEAMFSRDDAESISKAGQRIGRLLAPTQKQCVAIGKTFTDIFRVLRNDIAHGDPNLSRASVLKQLPVLYQYVGKAIAELVLLPPIDPAKDYYAEIERIAHTRYLSLPKKQ